MGDLCDTAFAGLDAGPAQVCFKPLRAENIADGIGWGQGGYSSCKFGVLCYLGSSYHFYAHSVGAFTSLRTHSPHHHPFTQVECGKLPKMPILTVSGPLISLHLITQVGNGAIFANWWPGEPVQTEYCLSFH